MKVIGITGGVGNGKSRVMDYLARQYGAAVVQADQVAKELMEPGGSCYEALLRLLGPGYTKADGSLDRPQLAAAMFGDDDLREKINGLVHPAVKAEIVRRLEKARADGTKFYFIEAALLIEDNYDVICDELWYIYADETVRTKRLIAARGYTAEKVREIMAKQLPPEEFVRHTVFTVDNSGDFSVTMQQIEKRMRDFDETM